MFWLVVTALIAIAVYVYFIKPYSYWQDLGIPYMKPWPIVGNMGQTVFRRKHFMDVASDFYTAFPNRRYNGIFQFMKPVLLIRDLELVKRITVKDFDHFTDHNLFVIDESYEPLMGKNLFSLKGKRWREMRITLSPAFTGSKMRGMFVFMKECGEQFNNFLAEELQGKLKEFELKDIYTRFTNDVIATCAFGLKCDSLKERDNQFYMLGKEVTKISALKGLLIFFGGSFPRLVKALKIKFFSDEVANFFRRIVKETIQLREKEGLVRPDMIHLLMEARKGRLKHDQQDNPKDAGFSTVEESDIGKAEVNHKQEITDEDITAQALIFFFGGFDSPSNLMCLMSYALAIYPDIQEKLHEEVDATLKKYNGKFTYEAIMEMKYLDMVVSETQRMWPLAFLMDRHCVQDYTIEPELPDEKPVHIKKGDVILIPVIGIHHDPKYFPDPEQFDPERFSDENKHNILPYSYMPFGMGPRNCIASRFALLETKTLFAHLLSKFDLVATEKTKVPLVIDPASFNPMPKGGFWVGFQQRKNIKV